MGNSLRFFDNLDIYKKLSYDLQTTNQWTSQSDKKIKHDLKTKAW